MEEGCDISKEGLQRWGKWLSFKIFIEWQIILWQEKLENDHRNHRLNILNWNTTHEFLLQQHLKNMVNGTT